MIFEHAIKYQALGYVVVPLELTEVDGKKAPKFLSGWQKKSTLDSCLGFFDKKRHNALAIKTGYESDVIVLDCDVPKEDETDLVDGVTFVNDKFLEHGDNMTDHLVARTGNNGMHLYFSLSTSIAAGLGMDKNTAKLPVKVIRDGKEVVVKSTIDIRGEGGCDFAAPTAYANGRKKYVWMTDCGAMEVPAADLLPCPGWLITMMNECTRQRSAVAVKKRENTQIVEMHPPNKVQRTDNAEDALQVVDWLTTNILESVRPVIEHELHNKISAWYPKSYGGDFHVVNKMDKCGCCIIQVHTANGYHCEVMLPPCCIVKNYSSKCDKMVIGIDDVPIFRDIKLDPQSDEAFVRLFAEQQRYQGLNWIWSGEQRCFFKYDGTIYKKMRREDIGQDIAKVCKFVVGKVGLAVAHREPRVNKNKQTSQETTNDSTKKPETWASSFLKASKYLHKAQAIKNIIEMATFELYDSTLEEKLDMDPNLLGCNSGIIDLRTGSLVINDPSLFVSKQAPVEYRGLGHPAPDVEAFLRSIFNEDEDLIGYIQRILGYGLTGLCREEIFVVFYGAGGNGKSLLNKLTNGALGPYWNTMSRDCVFKAERRGGPGAPSPHLAMLKGLRVAVLDDCGEQESLDDGTIKKMTSGVPMDARMLNANPVIFTPTHLPIICTNHLPKINVDDEAIERRLVLTPFANNYRPPDKFDPDNPTHRPIDMTLGERLATPEVLEQFLAWMVRGAVAWYKEGLGPKPAVLSAAKEQYYQEFDDIGRFIKESCDIGPNLSMSTSAFKQALADFGVHKSAPDIKKALEKKGFRYKRLTAGIKIVGMSVRS
eukprot:jgi/Astpho2/8016/fgenesh1_pg.00120_%23_12_t